VGSPVGWHPVERALQVSAGVENITAKSTPKKDVLVTAMLHFLFIPKDRDYRTIFHTSCGLINLSLGYQLV
jgi:hypothetical protein